jgi:hypothetical protein
MNNFSPMKDIESEWKEARYRLEIYLRTLHLTDPQQQERIIHVVLQRAAGKYAENADQHPTALVMKEMHDLSEQWLAKITQPSERMADRGLVSLFAIDAGEKWPVVFLAEEVPADFKQTLQQCEVRAAPDLRVSRMVPQPFESPLGDMNLPSALGQLTKDLSPSLVAKVAAVILSGIAFLSGNRMR